MIEIIPAIDIIGGKCVRLSKGDYDCKKIYNDSPLEVAKSFEGVGCKHLHLVDLDGAKSSHIVNYKTLEEIATKTNLIIDFGGGIKTDEDIKIAFDSGATKITGGSIAVKNRPLFESWIKLYGADKIILGADAKNEKIATDGWLEDSQIELIPFIKEYMKLGINTVISTDINRDGMLEGPACDLYKKIAQQCANLYVIASGGVSNMTDVEELDKINIPAVIVGKAIYEGRITLSQLEQQNLNL